MGSFFSTADSKSSGLVNERNAYTDFIDTKLKSNQIVLFSKTTCGYCTRAKNLLYDLKLDYYSIELDQNENCPRSDCQQLIENLIAQTRMKTVPQIFVNGKLIGGFSEMAQLVNDGTFSKLLLKNETNKK